MTINSFPESKSCADMKALLKAKKVEMERIARKIERALIQREMQKNRRD